ncbi:sensor histidine kinase [Rufibacter quisquiliarum]|uniref:histidine kinase n=1 Tax=Rufibacter quisquiliarum TaxID=1549639 RepID=A0A839GRJ2_9BACT|nr:HAMP domain-containing sensor histidine kinase [Rufibacter quisquiliarum]MBA9078125.1 signal transduction histidine kinase [Rufibacter quisquiliarum]
MKRRIHLVLLMMVTCTVGVVGLQLIWSYQSYRTASQEFTRDINEALQEAVKLEQDARRRELLQQYRGWLADTNLVKITCRVDPIYKTTKFSLADKHPWAPEKREPFVIGFNHFTQKLSKITPAAKAYFIKHFTEDLVWQNLQEGSLYFYTRQLGNKMEVAYTQNRLNPVRLKKLFRQQLQQRDITAGFELILEKQARNRNITQYPYATRSYNVSLRKPRQRVQAYFPDPNLVFLQRMKWVIGSSLLLIVTAIFCFGYTLKTLFRQKKLAVLKNDFVNNMTHELKTPVATISLAAEAIQAFDLSKASAEEYISIVRQQSGRLSGLIDQILKSVALEQENVALERKRICLQELTAHVLAQHKPQLELVAATVETQFPHERLVVTADELHLGNVLATLLDNALKYSNNQLRLQLSLYRQAHHAVLEIADNGLGIAPDHQAKVFEKFYRVPAGNVHNVKGYGLGLSYAKAVAERHGGTLTLRSRLGIGTTFLLSIPLARHEAPAPVVA